MAPEVEEPILIMPRQHKPYCNNKNLSHHLKLITCSSNHQIWNLFPSFWDALPKSKTKTGPKPLTPRSMCSLKKTNPQLLVFKPSASGLFPLTISRFAVAYLVMRILSVPGAVSGDFLTRPWLRAWSLSSVPRSTSPRTWWHGSAGIFCCHNKLEADRIQYNHVGVLFHLAFAKHRSKICTWWRTTQLYTLPYPQSLMVDLRGIIHER